MLPPALGTGALRRFSTDTAPSAERARLFQSRMQEMFSVGLSVSSAQPRPLAAQVMAYRGRSLRFAALRFSPHSTAAAGGPRAAESRLLVSLHKEGVARVSQDGRESRIEAGDVFVIDPARPFGIETGDIAVHSVYLPPSALRALVPDLDQLTALPIGTRGGAGALFRAAVDELVAQAPALREDAADRIADALPHLLAPALASIEPRPGGLPSRLKLLHKQRILRFVREHLADPALDANAVARAVQLSPRHVYDLFADEPEPLMKRVWSERLERCRNDLAQPALQARTIGEIAYGWGFSDVSHFSRAFKQRFGLSPRAYRGAALAAPVQ